MPHPKIYYWFSNMEITQLRDKICRELGWEPTGHRFQIYALSPVQEHEEEEAADEPGT